MTEEELINNGLTKEEVKEVIKICGNNCDWSDVPTYIKEKVEARNKARYLSQLEEEAIQIAKERKEKEKIEMAKAEYFGEI